MENIDEITINFDASQLFLLNICLAFIMFGVALDLKQSDFVRLFRSPGSAIVGLTSQLILLPILTFGLISVWPMASSMALGLIMVASCPGGNVSNYAVHLGGGNTALSISLTSIVSSLAVFITPITFAFWSSLLPGSDAILKTIEVSFGDMIQTVAMIILVPLIAGMAIRADKPVWAARIRGPISKLSFLIFTAILVVALYGNLGKMKDYLPYVFWIVLVHNGLALFMGYYFAKLNKRNEADCKAICMETGIQNSGLGLVLIFSYFHGLGGMVLIAAWWGVWDMISAMLLSSYWKFRLAKKQKFSSV